MKEITINEKLYKIPETLHELTLKDYCRIFKGVKFDKTMEWKDIKYSEATLISRILGEGDNFALSLPLAVYNYLCETCTFLYDVNRVKHNATIELNGVKYTIPSPEEFNLRKWIDVDVTRQSEDPDMFVQLYAILIDPIGEDGKCKPYEGGYEERIPLLENYPADEAMSMINDFFAKGESSQKVMDAYSKAEEAIERFAHNTKSS